jgi:hypothetical protein
MAAKVRRRRRPRSTRCKGCGRSIKVAIKGRVPTYCGQPCKQRAYKKRQLSSPMVLLSQDIATMKVREIIRREIWDILTRAGLVSGSPPLPDKPKREKPRLRIVPDSDN